MRWSAVCLLLAAGCLAPPSRESDDPAAPDPLALAADALDRGDQRAAVVHLTAHVRGAPDDAMSRSMLAELLFKARRPDDARREYERFVAVAQRAAGPVRNHLVHAHTRLMALAEADGDAYREELHRGVGLLLLVRRWDADPGRRDDAAADETLNRASAALRAALKERPHDARAHWYLAEVYGRQGQSDARRTALRAAKAAAPVGLTDAEAEAVARAE